jgi:hypothetical protein
MDLYIPRFIEQKKPFEIELKTTVSGKYKVSVCRNGQIVRKPFGDRWLSNLITNAGLDLLMQGTQWSTVISGYCRAGSGVTTPTNSDTQLTSQLKSTNTQFTGGGVGTTIGTSNDTTNGAATHTNVFEFSAEVSSVTYNEIGLASTAGPTGGTLFTHSLLPSGVNLLSGDNLRLTYAITLSFPATVTPVTVTLAAINGFNISGQLKVVGTFASIFGNLPSSGGITASNDQYLRCALAAAGTLLSTPTVFPAVNTAISPQSPLGNGVTGSLGSYTTGSYTRTQQFIYVPSNPSTTVSNANGFIVNANTLGNGNYGLLHLMTSPQTKANTNTLTINFSSSIARA